MASESESEKPYLWRPGCNALHHFFLFCFLLLSYQRMAAQLWLKGEVVIVDIFRSSLKSSQLSAVFGGAKKQFKGKIRSVLPWKFGFRRH